MFRGTRYGPDNNDWTQELGRALNGRAGVEEIMNMWSHASNSTQGDATQVAIAGAYGLQSFNNRSVAKVGSDAKINQRIHNDQQTVSVVADTSMLLISLVGLLELEISPEGN